MAPLPWDGGLSWLLNISARDLLVSSTATTQTTRDIPTIVARQAPATITVIQHNGGGATNLIAGAIARIVLGCIFATLLICWILRSCFNLSAPPGPNREAWYHDVGEKPRRHRPRSRPRRVVADVAPRTPVVVRDHSRSSGRPSRTYVYTEEDSAPGRHHHRSH